MLDTDLVVVRNRNNGTTGYVLPDSNIRRSFAVGESKKIPLGELKSLQYAPGGSYMLDNLLIIESKAALEELNMQVEPEYFYTEKEIKNLLYNADMNAFLDFLDFASEGAIQIAKDIAVNERIPDTRKREALSEKTGFNIDNAINIQKILDVEEEKKEEEKKERRTSVPEEKPSTPQRRTSAPEVKIGEPKKYNVIKTEK